MFNGIISRLYVKSTLLLSRCSYATPRQDTIAQQGGQTTLRCVCLDGRLSPSFRRFPLRVMAVARLLSPIN